MFLLTGALLGLLAGLWLATFGAAPTATGGAGAVGYLAAMGTFFGALLGGTVAVVAESLLNRRRPGRPGGRRGGRQPRRR